MYLVRKNDKVCMLVLEVVPGRVYSPIARCNPKCPICNKFSDGSEVKEHEVERLVLEMVACYGVSAEARKVRNTLRVVERLGEDEIATLYRLYEQIVARAMRKKRIDRIRAISVAERVLAKVLRDLMERYLKYL